MFELKVEGATCGGCVSSIEKAVSQLAGVDSVKFNLETKLAEIEGTVAQSDVIDAIEMAGFDVVANDD
jgi:copper chaperone CopZ